MNDLGSAAWAGAKWAGIFFAVAVIGTLLPLVSSDSQNLDKVLAVKLVTLIMQSLAVFVAVTLWRLFRKPSSGSSPNPNLSAEEIDELKKQLEAIKAQGASKWNFLGMAIGLTAIVAFFGKPILNGTLLSSYGSGMGILIWIFLIFYCTKNLVQNPPKKSS